MRVSIHVNEIDNLKNYPFNATFWGTFSDLLMVLITIITICYLRKTFKLQGQQIADAKKDNELNRVTDLVYRQLEITRKILTEYDASIKELCGITKADSNFFIDQYSVDRKKYNLLLSFLNNEVKIYKILIYKRAFNLSDINSLREIIINNVGTEIFDAISMLNGMEGKFNSGESSVSDAYMFSTNLVNFRKIITKEGINEKFDIGEGITNGFNQESG
ncbi:hypothetical protein [Pedobacter sp.]